MTLGKLMKPKHSSVEASRLPEAEPAALATGLPNRSKSPHDAVQDEEVLNRMLEAEGNPGVMISWGDGDAALRQSGLRTSLGIKLVFGLPRPHYLAWRFLRIG